MTDFQDPRPKTHCIFPRPAPGPLTPLIPRLMRRRLIGVKARHKSGVRRIRDKASRSLSLCREKKNQRGLGRFER